MIYREYPSVWGRYSPQSVMAVRRLSRLGPMAASTARRGCTPELAYVTRGQNPTQSKITSIGATVKSFGRGWIIVEESTDEEDGDSVKSRESNSVYMYHQYFKG